LWTILDNLIKHADLSAACLVSKKWLAIVGHKLDPIIRQTEFDLIKRSNHIPLRHIQKLVLRDVHIDNVSEYFEFILLNCKIVKFMECKFTNTQGLQKIIESCKNLDYLEIFKCSFEIGVIDSIITDIQCSVAHAEIKSFSWSLQDNNSWKLIKTFNILGIQLNNLNLSLIADEFDMKLINYIKTTYVTKLKKLHITYRRNSTSATSAELFQFLIDWDDLKLDDFGYLHWDDCRNIARFVEKQTSLKTLSIGGYLIYIDKYPVGLESLDIGSSDRMPCRSTINKICQMKNLRVFTLGMSDCYDDVLDFEWLKQMVTLVEFSFYIGRLRSRKTVFMMQEFNKPLQKIRIVSLSNVIICNQTMQASIKNMPNLESLTLDLVSGVSELKKKSN
jgi:hypothetical protein